MPSERPSVFNVLSALKRWGKTWDVTSCKVDSDALLIFLFEEMKDRVDLRRKKLNILVKFFKRQSKRHLIDMHTPKRPASLDF